MRYLPFVLLLTVGLCVSSCGDNENEDYQPPQEYSADKEKELQEREEFLRLKEEELRRREQNLDSSGQTDTTSQTENKDSVKTEEKKTEKKEDVQKEKELNTRLDNPKATIDDYLEYIKRGTEGGEFDKNMSEASKLWDNRSVGVFKKNYKDTDKFIIVSDPKVVSSNDKSAKVKVDIKTVDKNGNESEMTVTYNLIPDSKGKWKIKGNTLIKKQ